MACGRRASDLLCGQCYGALPFIDPPFCLRCSLPTAFEVYGCSQCSGRDYKFYAARAPLRYDGAGKEIVHAIKYRGRFRGVVERLAAPMMLKVLQGSFDAVVPVPLHPSRLRRRGFNQAELMARGVADRINTVVSDKLKAVRKTADQVELTAAARMANVRGAYVAQGSARGRVLLVDDVFTTGATLNACSEVLMQAGADEVFALTLCRTC